MVAVSSKYIRFPRDQRTLAYFFGDYAVVRHCHTRVESLCPRNDPGKYRCVKFGNTTYLLFDRDVGLLMRIWCEGDRGRCFWEYRRGYDDGANPFSTELIDNPLWARYEATEKRDKRCCKCHACRSLTRRYRCEFEMVGDDDDEKLITMLSRCQACCKFLVWPDWNTSISMQLRFPKVIAQLHAGTSTTTTRKITTKKHRGWFTNTF